MTPYERMLLVRMVEVRLREMGAELEFQKHAEAVVVGICLALRSEDRIVTSRRTVSHEIAMGTDLVQVVAESLGGPGSRIAATGHAVATGIAWTMKNVWKSDGAVVYFSNDLTELNGASLPLLLVCDRAPDGCGVRTHRVDGSSVAEVREVATRMLADIRHAGCGVLEACPTGDPLLRIEERFTDGAKRRAEAESRIRPMFDDVFARVAKDPIAEWKEDR